MAAAHPWRDLAEACAAGALDDDERAGFEAHQKDCDECRQAASAAARALGLLPRALDPRPPAPSLKQELLDLAHAPRGPVDLSAYAWHEPIPGIKMHVVEEDPGRGMRACLVWAKAGVVNARHRHAGGETILVLSGGLRDERGTYHPGDVCRSRAGSVHHEEILPDEDCVAYVLYYGELEFL